jgi:uncharacterized phage-associated protein
MPISPEAAARRICQNGNWSVTNLALQKILYLSQMIFMGRNNGARLIDGRFEAWDYGPVQPDVYRKVAMFGSKPIQDVFYGRAIPLDTLEADTLDEVSATLLAKSASELVAITHWENGAWAHNYRPNVRGIIIPERDILDEYRARNS